MKKMTKRIISMMLTVCLLFLASVPVFAADEDEEYLSDLRLIYADDYDEAEEILEESELEGYVIFDANLNENTGKTGVYLAFKTTTDIEAAITDIAIMQMNGGYNEGNYQEMIAQSLAEYEKMGANYLDAINYFREGYNAGNYLSEIAYRQLNFYNVVTEGVDEIPEFEGERIGDIFLDGIDLNDLATMFMQGNVYALNNIRSLLAMGVSYNADGKTYLEKVGVEAEKYNADKTVYNNENYSELATMIAPSITVIRDMLKELEAHKVDLNYDDDELTDLEYKYMENLLISEMLQDVNYLDGKTLYDFCLNYTAGDDNSNLYPLVAALNDGQIAMTRVAHYYDVVRYSMTLETNEDIDTALAEAEEKYGDAPFNVYEGVDRTIFYDTFALTSAAYRADAYTESGLSAALYSGNLSALNIAATVVGGVGAGIFAAGLIKHGYTKFSVGRASSRLESLRTDAFNNAFRGEYDFAVGDDLFDATDSVSYFQDGLMESGYELPQNFQSMTFEQKYDALNQIFVENQKALSGTRLSKDFTNFKTEVNDYLMQNREYADAVSKTNNVATNSGMNVVYGMYIAGGLMMLVSAITLGIQIYNYYHPDYDDIPTAMVDLIDTKDGDRYIKYDVVYEVECNEDGGYSAADLNAFSAERWNAMYYTKSYEAGKPLLADEFVISTNNNMPEENHAPVHRFGEVVSYNLNKYNFNDDHSIYLSVKQSDNQKSAVADVPEVIGSVFSAGYYFLAGGVGIAAGVGGTIGTMEIIKRRKNKTIPKAEATEEV